MRDLKSNVDVAFSLAPAARTNGTADGSAVNLDGYRGAEVVFNFGAWTDGTHTPSLLESADGTTYTPVGTADLDGTLAAVSGTAGQNAVQRQGYLGTCQYLKARLVTASATTGALSSATVVRGYPALRPLA